MFLSHFSPKFIVFFIVWFLWAVSILNCTFCLSRFCGYNAGTFSLFICFTVISSHTTPSFIFQFLKAYLIFRNYFFFFVSIILFAVSGQNRFKNQIDGIMKQEKIFKRDSRRVFMLRFFEIFRLFAYFQFNNLRIIVIHL